MTGSQEMYGDETLHQVADNSGLVASQLDESPTIPVRPVHRPSHLVREHRRDLPRGQRHGRA